MRIDSCHVRTFAASDVTDNVRDNEGDRNSTNEEIVETQLEQRDNGEECPGDGSDIERRPEDEGVLRVHCTFACVRV